ncbi:uncharacterized protein Z520_03033 [Fonsecaea multimorphosa CBS 102226]|uniref:Uncharacterized protein n=1 Tax=Fonsecaea multimorphosa CBS 102226 TaxID=1442371 RepID=A0A0D2HHW6_9EURO|nr:uncharacterized protein Z520_03033 [Fonsecaea multimorphosa CBS 102226]KIY01481.1 hypothetical protein Z520_03033 [Fonsecaea multimorphosa CBS 102226]OAL28244.1 hypothetical protein AYO22_02950 [Fonsecaea multimorphosa]
MTTRSHRLARLIGPALFTITLCETLNAPIFASSTAPTVFLNGSVIFVSGLAIVQAHNLWRRSWPVLVTLVGWGGVALGLARMLVPEKVLESVKGARVRDVRIGAAVVAGVGAVVSWFGYFGS